jgi:ATP-dependent Clp protease ATP-binding subunit ClpC
MLPKELKKLLDGLYPVLELEDIFPHHIRKILLDLSAGISLVMLFMLLVLHSGDPHVRGGFITAFAISLWLGSLEAYFYSIFARAGRGDYKMSFEIARLVYYADDADLTRGLLFADVGDLTMRRLGFTEQEVKKFLAERQIMSFKKCFDAFDGDLSVESYADLICRTDKGFSDLLFSKGLRAKEFTAALRWSIGRDFRRIENERIWSRAHLSRIPPLARNSAYGETYFLNRYGEDLSEEAATFDESYEKVHKGAVERFETVLSRGHDSNAVIVSDDERSRLDVVMMLAQWIKYGKSRTSLGHKRLFLLNPNLLIEGAHDKLSFERDLTALLIEASRAGNVILVFPAFSAFLRSALALGSDALAVLAPYLGSPALHIVALDTKTDYHSQLESRETIATHFEMIDAGTGSDEGLVGMLESEAEMIEKHSHMFVTYPAVMAAAESAKQYFDLASIVEKAKDLLIDAPRQTIARGSRIVTKDDVLSVAGAVTGIPTAKPEGKEKQKLLHITDLLRERVIGQEEAVTALGEALKRSRAGVGNPDKPMGTFLFLGPTGVGKTETAKALADVFFGSEKEMSRLDMSEYRDNFAIERLIGSFASGKSGRLPELLRERPYGVLLLDEFEKTTPEVMNVFLRLFDEGVVTDAEGRKANAKNSVIIATSNAGSDMIWDIVRSGGDLSARKQEVIEMIVAKGIMKPELLNRFDAVVLFHPLLDKHLREVARLMTEKFAKHMLEKGLKIEVTDGALDHLVAKGTDPKFGARPMQRAISEEIERKVAEMIIEGSASEGSTITFDKDPEGKLTVSTS